MLATGQNAIALPADAWRPAAGCSGRQADLGRDRARRGDRRDAGLRGRHLRRAEAATVTGLKPNAAAYREGDTMSVVARVGGTPRGPEDAARGVATTWAACCTRKRSRPAASGLLLPARRLLGQAGHLSAELVDGGARVVDQMRAAPVVVTPRERGRRSIAGSLSFEPSRPLLQGRSSLRRLREQAMDDGFTWGGAVNDEPERPARLLRGLLVRPRPHHARGHGEGDRRRSRRPATSPLSTTSTKKELYRRTRRQEVPVRSPTSTTPRRWARWPTSRAPPPATRPSTTWTTTSSATRARSPPTATRSISTGARTRSRDFRDLAERRSTARSRR